MFVMQNEWMKSFETFIYLLWLTKMCAENGCFSITSTHVDNKVSQIENFNVQIRAFAWDEKCVQCHTIERGDVLNVI